MLLAILVPALASCTTLLGDFTYDPNAKGAGGSAGAGLEQGDIVVTPTSGLFTNEQGAKAIFTIGLKVAPKDNVAIALSSSDETEGKVSPNVVSFTPDNFAAPQMVQVIGVNDELPDGPQEYSIRTSPATSGDQHYHGIDPFDPVFHNADDDTAGFTLSPTAGLVTTESGGETTFSIALNYAPTADVTIPLTSDTPSEGTVSPASLVFTSLDWMAPQLVTVTGVNDDAADGPQIYRIVTETASSADTNYNGLNPPDQSVTNQDNDTAGITLSPATGLITFESGAMTSFGIALNAPPEADVTVSLTSSQTSEGTVTPESVTFTSLNWMAAQSVALTGVDDERADGNQPYTVIAEVSLSNDSNYAALPPVVADVINIDNDTPGLTLMPTQGLTTSELGLSASFSVVLNSSPSGEVLLDVASARMEEGIAIPTSLAFTPENWNAPQIVTVMGVDDSVADGPQTYVVHVRPNSNSADAAYAALLEQDVTVSNTDDDSPSVIVSPRRGLTTTESGGSATFGIHLGSEPTAEVTIALSSSNTSEGTVSPAKLTFTPANYAASQMVVVRGANDSTQDGNQPYRIITENAVSQDPGYSGREVANVEVTNTDDDSAGITVSPPADRTLITSEKGTTATFSVVLNSEPAAEVSFSVTSTDASEGTANPSSLKFTKDNWNAPQTVTIKGQNDDSQDGAQLYRIAFGTIMSADPNYAGDRLKPLDVKVRNTDDDTAGISLQNAANLTTNEAGTTLASFGVVLDSKPKSTVTIGFSSSRSTEGTVAPSSLSFTETNWAAPQTVTISGVDDDIEDGHQKFFVIVAPATSDDVNYNGRVPNTGNPSVTNLDNDSASIRVKAPAGISTTEPSGTTTFTVELNSQPTADVTIPLRSNRPTEGTVSPASLTFTRTNWSSARTVTLTGGDDQVQDGAQLYVVSIGPASSADGKYDGLSAADLTVSNRDNDTADIRVSAISGDTTEKGGTASFTVVLSTEPKDNVTLTLSSSNTSEGTVNPAALTFTPLNWASPQTVTVTGENDKKQDGPQPYTILLAKATSKDPNYDGLQASDVPLTNQDDDTANLAVSVAAGDTSESGATTTFSIVLVTEPSASVQIPLTSSNSAEGTLSDSSVTFSTLDWSSPKTITVTGVNDDGVDGNQAYSIIIGPAKSMDQNYAGKTAPPVSIINIDDDSAGITVTPKLGSTSEDGGTLVFTVVLTSKPRASVAIPVSSSNLAEGTVSTSLLTFTTTNWGTQQTVTVTGVDDNIVDGSAIYSIKLAAPTSDDADYAKLDPDDVSVTNVDNDTAGFTVTNAAGRTSEAGAVTSFTIRLTSQPRANVTIPLSSSDTTEGTLTGGVTSVVFTTDDWNIPRKITVQGQNDAEADGPQPYSIVTGFSTSPDSNYENKVVPDISIVNEDDDTAAP